VAIRRIRECRGLRRQTARRDSSRVLLDLPVDIVDEVPAVALLRARLTETKTIRVSGSAFVNAIDEQPDAADELRRRIAGVTSLLPQYRRRLSA